MKIQMIGSELARPINEIVLNSRNAGVDPEEARQQIAELQKQALEKSRALLTDSQRKTLSDLTGKPFEFVYERPQR